MQDQWKWEFAARMLAAFVAGAIVGWERETHGRPAGLRTTVLACTAAALAMIISEVLYTNTATASTTGATWRPDPARLGAGILTGIGFLGAGTIIRNENFVRGVTTAASLWFVTVVGLAFGSGQFLLGWIGMGIAILTLFLLPLLERHIPSDWYAKISLTVLPNGISEEQVLEELNRLDLYPTSMKAQFSAPEAERRLTIGIRCKRPRRFELCSEIVARFSKAPGVIHVAWE